MADYYTGGMKAEVDFLQRLGSATPRVRKPAPPATIEGVDVALLQKAMNASAGPFKMTHSAQDVLRRYAELKHPKKIAAVTTRRTQSSADQRRSDDYKRALVGKIDAVYRSHVGQPITVSGISALLHAVGGVLEHAGLSSAGLTAGVDADAVGQVNVAYPPAALAVLEDAIDFVEREKAQKAEIAAAVAAAQVRAHREGYLDGRLDARDLLLGDMENPSGHFSRAFGMFDRGNIARAILEVLG